MDMTEARDLEAVSEGEKEKTFESTGAAVMGGVAVMALGKVMATLSGDCGYAVRGVSGQGGM
jgi:hypothetical protein